MEYMVDTLKPYTNSTKENLILFPHRLAPEKQVDIFKDLAKEMPEYNWIGDTLQSIEPIFPNLIGRGYFHVPDIDTSINSINIATNLETEVDGLFVCGECAGIKGIAAAGITGAAAAEGAAK